MQSKHLSSLIEATISLLDRVKAVARANAEAGKTFAPVASGPSGW
jgi:hypothetical protein